MRSDIDWSCCGSVPGTWALTMHQHPQNRMWAKSEPISLGFFFFVVVVFFLCLSLFLDVKWLTQHWIEWLYGLNTLLLDQKCWFQQLISHPSIPLRSILLLLCVTVYKVFGRRLSVIWQNIHSKFFIGCDLLGWTIGLCAGERRCRGVGVTPGFKQERGPGSLLVLYTAKISLVKEIFHCFELKFVEYNQVPDNISADFKWTAMLPVKLRWLTHCHPHLCVCVSSVCVW